MQESILSLLTTTVNMVDRSLKTRGHCWGIEDMTRVIMTYNSNAIPLMQNADQKQCLTNVNLCSNIF